MVDDQAHRRCARLLATLVCACATLVASGNPHASAQEQLDLPPYVDRLDPDEGAPLSDEALASEEPLVDPLPGDPSDFEATPLDRAPSPDRSLAFDESALSTHPMEPTEAFAEQEPFAGDTAGGDDWGHDFPGGGLAPFDWVRSLGFRHSSTHGRHVGRGLPLERSSWLNRPLHVDWFAGPLITDSVDPGRVGQSNDVLGGIRLGWDFDYYWGAEWRFGWAEPVLVSGEGTAVNGDFFVSDFNVIYYPWGDSKIRPYGLWGLGLTQIASHHQDGTNHDATLVGMPFGGGIQFAQTRVVTWRLEILDNLAFGDNGISTMHNFSFTLGMELRLGPRPKTYWPWRSGRTVW